MAENATVQGAGKEALTKTKETASTTPIKRVPKEPDFYIFRLLKANKNRRGGADPEYPPYYSIPNTDIIKWKRPDGVWTTRKICYIDGVDTIFADEQKDVPKEMLQSVRNKPVFNFGEIAVPSYNKTLKMFLDYCSKNIDSEFRRDNVAPLYKTVDENKEKLKEREQMQMRKKAFELAFNNSDEDMLAHATMMGIPFVNNNTGGERDIELIRLDYQKIATERPQYFLESHANPLLKIAAMVKSAMESGQIRIAKGQAMWSSSNAPICTIPMDKDPVQHLASFAVTDQGASFAVTLKTL